MKFSDWFQKPDFSDFTPNLFWALLFILVCILTCVPGCLLEIISFGAFRYIHLLNEFETFCMRKMS